MSKFRVGRVFLAGDAVHIHHLAGAQGMNPGIGNVLSRLEDEDGCFCSKGWRATEQMVLSLSLAFIVHTVDHM